MSMDERPIVQRAAERLKKRDSFMAHRLDKYLSVEGVSRGELAMRLGCDEEGLLQMELCLAPTPGGVDFVSKLEKIAAYGGADANALIQAIRRVDSIEAIRAAPQRGSPHNDAGLLLAARDSENDLSKNQED